jgi:hypothetical protein
MKINTKKEKDDGHTYYVSSFSEDPFHQFSKKVISLQNTPYYNIGGNTKEASQGLKEIYVEDCNKLIRSILNLIEEATKC